MNKIAKKEATSSKMLFIITSIMLITQNNSRIFIVA